MTERRDDWEHSEARGHIQLLAQIEQPSLYIDTIALAPDGSSLAVAPLGSGIGIWNIETAIQYSVLEMPEDYLTSTLPDSKTIKEDGAAPVLVGMIAFSDDGAFVAAAFTTQEVGIWMREGSLLETI